MGIKVDLGIILFCILFLIFGIMTVMAKSRRGSLYEDVIRKPHTGISYTSTSILNAHPCCNDVQISKY